MALIRATCSDCGDVELRSRDLRVRTCTDTEGATYLFRCPVCRMIEVRPAEPHVVDVLLAADHLIDIEISGQQSFEQMQAVPDLTQAMLETTAYRGAPEP